MATYTVTNSADDGADTLRFFIGISADGDIIDFDPAITTIILDSDELTIDRDITINGMNNVTVTRSSLSDFRIFHILDSAEVTINGLTISNGRASGNGGGGILVEDTSILHINNSIITGNNSIDASPGAGIAVYQSTLIMSNCTVTTNISSNSAGGFYVVESTVTIDGSTISENIAGMDSGGIRSDNTNLTITNSIISENESLGGGGISIYDSSIAGFPSTIILTNVLINNNQCQQFGGGIYINKNDLGSVTLTDCTISFNTSITAGGGFMVIGSEDINLILNNTSISDNTSNFAGGLYIYGLSLQMNDSRIERNVSNNMMAGGMYLSSPTNNNISNTIISNNQALTEISIGGGLVIDTGTSVTISYSTISNNSAGAQGGGISGLNTSRITLVHSTVSHNSAPEGAGLYLENIENTFVNTTIANNTADILGGGIYISNNTSTNTFINITIAANHANNAGGGIYNADAVINIGNSIIATNTNNEPQSSPDVFGTYSSLGYNLIGIVDGSSGFINPPDLLGTLTDPLNPMLNSLENNGGPTLTMRLRPNSPAIDNGNISLLPDPGDLWDQRGEPFLRIVGGALDIGAFELELSPIICYSGASKILTRNIETGIILEIDAKNVISGIHEVFNTETKSFIPVKLNIVTGVSRRYMLIKENALGENKPNHDLYITSGHYLIINGKRMKARDIPEAKRVAVKAQEVYSICTEKKCPILVNNLEVLTWNYNEWIEHSNRSKINWYDNQK